MEQSLVLVYKWERKGGVPMADVMGEENHAREAKPWSGRTLTRGLEFGSYAHGARASVER